MPRLIFLVNLNNILPGFWNTRALSIVASRIYALFARILEAPGIATPPQLALPEDFSLLVTQVFYLCLLFKLLNKPVFLRLGPEKRGPKGFQLEAPKLPVYISKGHSSQVL